MARFVIVSGLPASGKTTLARALAQGLGATHLDKDEFLQPLFDLHHAISEAQRHNLSRQADGLFTAAALRHDLAVLSSWWRPPGASSTSGTPLDPILASGAQLVEVHCVCSASTAARRFLARSRHPGHGDARRTEADLTRQFEAADRQGPLMPGCALGWSTDADGAYPAAEPATLVHQLRTLLNHAKPPQARPPHPPTGCAP